MKKILRFLLALIAVLSIFFYIKKDYEKAAPTLYFNGNIITLNEQVPKAEAILVADGKIVAIGTKEGLVASNQAKQVDLKGQTVLPGFIDVHTHFALSMFMSAMHDLSGFKHENDRSVWQYFETVVANSAPNEWLVCKGLDPILVNDLRTPSIQYLDSIAPQNPVVIFSQSLHSYWANTKAFEKAGIRLETENPSTHSYYEKDSTGNFTGLIVEQEAFKPFVEVLKTELLTSKLLSESAVEVMRAYAKNGNTTIVSTGLTINDSKALILTQHLSDEHPSLLGGLLAKIGQLPTRTPMPRHFIYMRHDMAHLLPNNRAQNDFYDIIGIKHWYDGSPYIGTMYMDAPYLDTELTTKQLSIPAGSSGKALVSKAALKDFITNYHTQGWQVAIHTQGDAAIKEVIEVYEALDGELDFSKSRHRLEHCLMLPTSELEAMKRLNLTPSFHVNHLYYYGDALHTDVLGAERTSQILPIHSTMQKGIVATLHADQPMFESQPFRLIQTAVERKTKAGMPLGEREKIELLDAIKALTIHAAWQINVEDKLGSLEKGKYADFIVLDNNPFEMPTEALHQIKCTQTYINGNKVLY